MKILEIPKNFNVIFKFGNEEIFVGEKIQYSTPIVNLDKSHISNRYMKKIGFTPFKTARGLVTKKIKVYENGTVDISDVCIYDRSTSSSQNIEQLQSLSDVLSINEIFDDCCFIFSKKEKLSFGKEGIIITKYQLNMNANEEITIKEIDNFWISFFEGIGIQVGKDNEVVDIQILQNFFNDTVIEENIWQMNIPEIIFDGFSGEYGFFDIYKIYKEELVQYLDLSIYNILKYYYYLGQKKYYFLCEYLIKNNMSKKIKDLNPVFTGKGIPEPKDIFVLSKTSMDIAQRMRGDKDVIEVLTKCEKSSKIGINGIKMIDEFIEIYNNTNAWNTSFRIGSRYEDMFTYILKILNIFDISLKVLIEKCIRATFYENYNPSDYLRLILDYVEMSHQLNIPLEKKLPQDIVRRHNLLQSQIVYIKNAKIEAMFKAQIQKNEQLLKFIPSSSGFVVICPNSPNMLIQEGLEMNHCVGSYTERATGGYSKIFLLRDEKTPNIPYVTIELNKNNLLVQAKGFSNSNPNKIVMNFIDEWMKNINKNI